jgi:asparagine synthase (glutamine-hydrolysing)
MGGIVAMFAPAGAVSAELLERATHSLRHRGPDQQGCWTAPALDVGLGYTRLGIVDPAGRPQPLSAEGGGIHAVVNGELYGFEPIREELEERGHQFRTGADSEILVHLYEELGVHCLRRLRGEFAFALWDEPNGLLFAARDRFGIKPLFYGEAGGVLVLASEAKALFAAGVPAAWDLESVYQQLFVCLEEDRSLFRGVQQIPPGHYLLASRHHRRIFRYWDLDYPPAGAVRVDEREIVLELRAALEEAVRLRLRADVPVGCFLSGGVDSSTVLGLAAHVSPTPVHAFTVTFDGTPWDEGPIARQTSERLGAVFHPLQVTERDIADSLADAVWHGEMLGLNTHGVARYVQCRQVRAAGYKVVLSGEGSDDILAGYPSAKQDSIAAAGQRSPPPAVTAAAMLAEGVPPQLLSIHRVLGFTPSWLRKVALGRSIFHALIAPDFARQFEGRDPYRVFLDRCDVAGQMTGREPVVQSLYLWSKAFLGGYALCAERLQMAFAVEERLPFLDHRLFDLVRGISAGLLVHQLREKYILREAARPYLTDTVYRRPKHSFTAPPVLAEEGTLLHTLAQDLLRSATMAEMPLFDRAAVIGLLDRLPTLAESTRISLDAVLLMIISSCILHERYNLS